MKNLITKPLFVGTALVVAFIAIASVATVSADRDAWTWTDKSSVLPRRDGITLTQSAERQGSWLLSDGSNLWRFDGTAVADMNRDARDRQLNAIKLLASDGRQWLIWNKGLDDRRGSLWLYEGSTWVDRTSVLPSSVESLEASGHDGQWYLNVRANGTTRLVFLNGSASVPQDVTLPLEASGIGHAAFVNGRWFWFGEQAGHLMVWNLNELNMTPTKNVPVSLHLSGVWTSDSSALIATSETPSNALFADRLWSFDGSTWTDLSAQAKASGLLPTDAAKMRVAFGGNAWMILSGFNLYRYDGYAVVSKGQTHDAFITLVGGNGFALTARSADSSAKLVLVSDDKADPEQPVAIPAPANANPVVASVSEPALRLDPTGFGFTSWTIPSGSTLLPGALTTYVVAAQDKTDGLGSIDIWVNGTVVKTCALAKSKKAVRCETNLPAKDFPAGTDIFMNARILDAKGNIAWVPGTTLNRPAAYVTALPPATSGQETTLKPTPAAGPVFAARLTIEPNTENVRRGTTLTVRAYAQNNTVGLNRIEITYGGQIRRLCSYGAAMSETMCDLTIDTSSVAENTTFSFVARAIDNEGREAWSNGQTILVRGANWSPATTAASGNANGLSQWSWLLPLAGEIESTQETTYSVGAWSPSGIAKIEMVVNGGTRKTCGFASGTASRDCSYVVRTGDWSHGQTVVVNARITDNQGRVTWSDAKSILISRAWWEPMNRPGAYVTVNANKSDGYNAGDKLSFTLTGWSPNGYDHLELWMNGKLATSFPSDIGTWTSAPLTADRVEFQARIVDRLGQETWTALYGLNKK